jgi:hypothetical protein
MGYTTDFIGSFKINKPLSEKMKKFLVLFNETRRMGRKVADVFGHEGEFYVFGGGFYGQDNEPNIMDFNKEPKTQPGLWCKWVPNEDGTEIVWDGGEKFYSYTEWLVYLIHKILKPNGYVLNGEMTWQGEETGDVGELIVENNRVFIEPYKGIREEKTPKNCGKFGYVNGKYKNTKNFMEIDTVLILDTDQPSLGESIKLLK